MTEDDRYLTAWGGLDAGLPLLAARPELGDLDDGYGLRHLVAHLALAGRTADVHRLLACEQPPSGGRLGRVNVWYDACERAGRIDGYLDDLAIAAELAREATDTAVAAGRPAPSFGLELRYALMAAAVRATAERTYDYSTLYRHDHTVAPMLVESGLWDVTRALAIARRIGDATERTAAVRALLPYVPAGDARQEVLGELVAGTLGSWEAKELLPQLSAETLERVLDRIEREHADGFPDPPFDQLAEYLPPGLLPRALAIAVELKDGIYRRKALQALVPLLPPDLAVEALASARALTDPAYRAQTLLDLVPRLPTGARPAALADAYAAITRIDPANEARLWALGTLIAQLPTSDPPPLGPASPGPAIAEPADALPSDPWDRAEVLAYAGRLVSAAERGPVVESALAAARLIADPLIRARMLMEIADLLPVDEQAGLLTEAYDAARTVTDPSYRGWVLTEVADALPVPGRAPVITEALAAANEIVTPASEDPGDRMRLVMAIADVMPAPERDEVLAGALDAVRAEQDEDLRYTLLLELAELLTGTDRHAALAEAVEPALEHIGYENYFSSLLGTLCPVLPEDLLARVLTELIDHAGPGYLGRVLVREAEHFTGEARKVALAAARDLDERPWYKTAALAALADGLPAAERAGLLGEAIAVARQDRRGLPQIARRLPPEQRKALLAEELAFPRRVFNDRRDAALAALPGTTPPVPFGQVTIESSRWMRDDELYDRLLHAQRGHREGEPPAVVIGRIREGLTYLSDLHNPGSAALACAAHTFGGPEADREYRTAVHDVYRWWADPRADP